MSGSIISMFIDILYNSLSFNSFIMCLLMLFLGLFSTVKINVFFSKF